MNENETNISNTTPQKSEGGTGALIGSIIIILIIILGAFYLFSTIKDQRQVIEQNTPLQKNSDEVIDIEADLNATDVENMDPEFESIEAEFQN